MIGFVAWVGCMACLLIGLWGGQEVGRKAAARDCEVAGVFVVGGKAYDCTPRQKEQK